MVRARQTWRLTYHALTRQYRLSTGVLHQNFTTLGEALRVLSRLYRWHVIDRDRVASETLTPRSRFRLDVSQLPGKPFRSRRCPAAAGTWNPDWKTWTFSVPAAAPVVSR